MSDADVGPWNIDKNFQRQVGRDFPILFLIQKSQCIMYVNNPRWWHPDRHTCSETIEGQIQSGYVRGTFNMLWMA